MLSFRIRPVQRSFVLALFVMSLSFLTCLSFSQNAPTAKPLDATTVFQDKSFDAALDTTQTAMEGGSFSAEEVQRQEQSLVNNPDDLKTRIRLLGYYQGHLYLHSPALRAARQKQILWVIEHHPEAPIAGATYAGLDPKEDQAVYAQAKQLWLQQVAKYPHNTAVLSHAAQFLDAAMAEKLLKQAIALEPDREIWSQQLASLYADRHDPRAAAMQLQANKVQFARYERAYQSYAGPDRSRLLRTMAQTALDARMHLQGRQYAQELLKAAAQHKGTDEAGDFLYDGNRILGMIALREGDKAQAKTRLLAAGATPGSSWLRSFGPNMSLAKALLAKGEKQVVLEFLTRCARFWNDPELELWQEQVRKGETPDFGKNE